MSAKGMKQELVYAIFKMQLWEAMKSLSKLNADAKKQHQKSALKLIKNVETKNNIKGYNHEKVYTVFFTDPFNNIDIC